MELGNSKVYREGGYSFGLDAAFPSEFIKSIIPHIQALSSNESLSMAGLSGRAQVAQFSLPEIGPVVLKPYRRGGLLGKVNSSTYVKIGSSRPAKEFALLQLVNTLHMNAPQPLVWITQGKFFYQGWLLMKEISHEYSLADYAGNDNLELEKILQNFAEQVERLIRASVYHVDLHPGNVLIDADLQAYIIDFDKACLTDKSPNVLRDLYLCRWRRAVIKHSLPEFLSEYVCAYLRKNFISDSSV